MTKPAIINSKAWQPCSDFKQYRSHSIKKKRQGGTNRELISQSLDVTAQDPQISDLGA